MRHDDIALKPNFQHTVRLGLPVRPLFTYHAHVTSLQRRQYLKHRGRMSFFTVRLKRLLDLRLSPGTLQTVPLSEITNIHRYSDPGWMQLHCDLEAYSTDKHVFKHTGGEIYRKGWEWTHCLYGLQKLGMIAPAHTGLGVGAGREPVIFWLADRIAHVTATDLYGNETWSKKDGVEAPADIVQDATKYCPRPYRQDAIRFENADGTNLPFPDNSFDFCWSLSSIEHFGGHEAAKKAVQEMGRVTRPGGVVCIATEFLLLEEQSHPEFFTRSQIQKFIITASPNLSLVDGMNWSLPPFEYLVDQICVAGEGVHRLRRHVVLNDGNCQWTSIMLFFRKSG